MTLKAIKQLADAARDGRPIVASMGVDALAEIAALEKAAKDIGMYRAMPTPTHEARHASIDGFVLLATIAKEAE